jgi:hypothetical protein
MKGIAPLSLGTLALLGCTGCLIWPFPTGELLTGRGRIHSEYVAPLEVGKATREDVLLRLGEPDEVLDGGGTYVYRWTEVRGYLVLGGYGSAAAIPFPGHRDLRLEFDAKGRLTRKTFGEQATENPPSRN